MKNFLKNILQHRKDEPVFRKEPSIAAGWKTWYNAPWRGHDGKWIR